jgi:hypothetical protein
MRKEPRNWGYCIKQSFKCKGLFEKNQNISDEFCGGEGAEA